MTEEREMLLEILEATRQLEEAVNEISRKQDETEIRLSDMSQAVNGWPSSYKLYKGAGGKHGAIQFDLTPKHKSKRELGAVFIQMAPAIGNNNYDWNNKINFALSLGDTAKILETFRSPPSPDGQPSSIYHDTYAGTERRGETTKSLLISKGRQSGFFFTLIEKDNGIEKKVSVPMSNGEAIILRNLLERSTIRALDW